MNALHVSLLLPSIFEQRLTHPGSLLECRRCWHPYPLQPSDNRGARQTHAAAACASWSQSQSPGDERNRLSTDTCRCLTSTSPSPGEPPSWGCGPDQAEQCGGELVTWIPECQGHFDGIIINPAAYTHTSIAIRDAIAAVALPRWKSTCRTFISGRSFATTPFIAGVALGQIAVRSDRISAGTERVNRPF